MSDRTALLALAERCEQAAGPDRELDGEIDAAIGWPTSSYFHQHTRRYTGSLDAAITLVPDGWIWVVGSYGNARVYQDQTAGKSFIGENAKPALALCAPALRARAAMAQPSSDT